MKRTLGLLVAVAIGMLAQAQLARTVTFTPAEEATLQLLAQRCSGSTATEIWCDGVNLRITNGKGHTNIDQSSDANGLGNIMAGYTEDLASERVALGLPAVQRLGIHGFITGRGNDWGPKAYAFVNTGKLSDVRGPYGGVITGLQNKAYDYALCAGGANNTCGAPDPDPEDQNGAFYTSVFGGRGNTALGYASAILGGDGNTATGGFSAVGAGATNLASASYSYVSGGSNNTASGVAAVVEGGYSNTASGIYSTVSGGGSLTASATNSWKAGSVGATTYTGKHVSQ